MTNQLEQLLDCSPLVEVDFQVRWLLRERETFSLETIFTARGAELALYVRYYSQIKLVK